MYLAGVDDLWYGKMDLVRAVREIPTDGVKILAMHERDCADTIGPPLRLFCPPEITHLELHSTALRVDRHALKNEAYE